MRDLNTILPLYSVHGTHFPTEAWDKDETSYDKFIMPSDVNLIATFKPSPPACSQTHFIVPRI